MIKPKILYAMCVAFFLAGFNVYQIDAPSLAAVRAADPSIKAHTDMFTLHQIGLIFMISTTLSVFLGLLKRVNAGFSVMTFILTWWTMLYVLSWIQTGYWQSIYPIANYGLNVVILILVSNIVEMPKNMQSPEDKHGIYGKKLFNLGKKEGGSA